MTDPRSRVTTYAFNTDSTLSDHVLHLGATTTAELEHWTYTYDAASRIKTQTRTGYGYSGQTANNKKHRFLDMRRVFIKLPVLGAS